MEATTNTFVALLQLKETTNKNRRLVVLKQFLSNPNHSEVEMMASAVFPLSQKYCALGLLKASSLEHVEDYVKDSHDVLDATFYKVTSFKGTLNKSDFNYALFAGHDALQDSLVSLAKNGEGGVQELLQIEFEGHDSYKKVYFLQADTSEDAIHFGKEQTDNCYLSLQVATSMQQFLYMKSEGTEPVAAAERPPCANMQPGKATTMALINDGAKQSFYTNSYFNLRYPIPGHYKITVNAAYSHICE